MYRAMHPCAARTAASARMFPAQKKPTVSVLTVHLIGCSSSNLRLICSLSSTCIPRNGNPAPTFLLAVCPTKRCSTFSPIVRTSGASISVSITTRPEKPPANASLIHLQIPIPSSGMCLLSRTGTKCFSIGKIFPSLF